MTFSYHESEWKTSFYAANDAIMSFDYLTAVNEYRRAVKIAERLRLGDEPLAESLEGLARALWYSGESADVSLLFSRASELRLKLLAETESALGPHHLDVAKRLDDCVPSFLWQNNPSQAIAFYQRALDIRINALGEDHIDVAKTLNSIGRIYAERIQDREAAAQSWRRAVAILDRLQENPDTRDDSVMIFLRVNLERLGINAFEQKEDAVAETWFRRVADLTGDILGSVGIAPIYAKVLVRLRKFEEAEALLEAASKITWQATAWREFCQDVLIDLYNNTGRLDEAELLRSGASSFGKGD